MPRQPRLQPPGTLQHITARGIDRSFIFLDDEDRQNFLTRLRILFIETQTRCFAWALLPDHFHLLLKTATPLSRIMRRLMTGYAVGFNKRHKRNGHLFQNRYKSIICQEELYFRELVCHIHLNPLRVGLVKNQAELDRYPWSGHGVLMGSVPNLLDTDAYLDRFVLSLFDQDPRLARRTYRLSVRQRIQQGRRPEFQGGGFNRSPEGEGEADFSRMKGGRPMHSDERILGTSAFVENILNQAGKEKAGKKTRMSLEDLVEVVSGWLDLDKGDLLAGRRKKKIGTGRALIAYIGHRELGYRFTELSQALNIHPVNAARNSDKGKALFNDFKSHWGEVA